MTVALSGEHLAFRDVAERFVAAEMPKEWARALEAARAIIRPSFGTNSPKAVFTGWEYPKNMAAPAATC
jgi:hypothetical protein